MPLDQTNWSQTETETKPDVFSLEGLIAWLETQPAEKEYKYYNCFGGCLIARYFTARGISFGMIGGSYWREMDGTKHPLGVFTNIPVVHPHTYGAALSRARALLAETRK